jgi:hypothetical protein
MKRCIGTLLAEMGATMRIIIGCTALLGLVVLAAVVWMIWIRPRFLRAMDEAEASPSSFTIEGLMELRDRGEISEDEFRTLRLSVLGLDGRSGKTGQNNPISDSSAAPAPADGQDRQEGDDSAQKENE